MLRVSVILTPADFFSGIHKLFHCAPNVPHYAKNKAVGVMKAGHSFTIEPMISEGTKFFF
jgi:methionyl aminopeptidase